MSAADVPKAELHVHLEGAARPSWLRAFAARRGETLPEGLLAGEDSFAFTDFLDFLATYDKAAKIVQTAEDYRDLTYAYLAECAQANTIYVELMVSPDHSRRTGLDTSGLLEAVGQGINDANEQFGIEARVLIPLLRHLGHERALELATEIAELQHPLIVGINLVGDEAGFPPEPFAAAYKVATDAGLGATAHAGEWGGPESIRGAMSLPGITRISHGVRAIEDPELVKEIADRGLTLEVCPVSNVVLGVFPDFGAHPLPALREAGVKVTLGSDDPPYFGTSIAREYDVAQRELGFDDSALRGMTEMAVEGAFADAGLRARLKRRLATV